ncbi:MAG: hypothetical protein EXS10_02035 [Phycisphaerales bacterium]|nr:hypothetical protein [Phycisphaerales bacterium]
MELLSTIRRRLLLAPLRIAVVDDIRAWRGIDLLVGSWHLQRAIAATTNAKRVGILLPTGALFPMATMACWSLGRTVVPINYLLSRADLEHVVKDSGIDACVTVGPMLDFMGGLPEGVQAIRVDQLKFKGIPPISFANPLKPDDLGVVLYTSGTSGKPKGVMLSVGNLQSNVRQIREWVRFDQRDVMLGVLPQFHSFGLTVLTLLPLLAGCKVIYTAKFVPRKLLDLALAHQPTAFVAIPSMYNALRLVRDADPKTFAALRFAVSGGEPLAQAVFDGFKERFGVEINEGYGLTETSPVSHWCRPQEQKRGWVGRAIPRVEVRIVGADEKDLSANEDGEVRLRGPNIMQGYLNLPEESAAAFDDRGFFRTGDMGRQDNDGRLAITGRLKEMLIVAGENVFPREIEEVLNRHPSVKDSAVIGSSDPSRGEVPVAFVEMKEGAIFDEQSIKAHCRTELAGFKVPREIRLIDALPRNPTGKIVRRKLAPLLVTDSSQTR